MAKKKLNKKLAMIASVALAFVLLLVIVVILRGAKDPDKLLADVDMYISQNDYEMAETNFRQAVGAAKSDERKIEILFDLADFYLIDNEHHLPDWQKAMIAWKSVLKYEPQNVKARMKTLKFFYETANNGNSNLWKTVQDEVSSLINLSEELDDEQYKYVLFAQARSSYEIAETGQTDDREKVANQAIEQLGAYIAANPDDVQAYYYLGESYLLIGRIQSLLGTIGAEDIAYGKALNALNQAIEAAPENHKAYLNVLELRTKKSGNDPEIIKVLQAEYEGLLEKFPDNAEIYASYATLKSASIEGLPKGVQLSKKAVELDPQNIKFAIQAANLSYQQGAITSNQKLVDDAIEISEKALELPDAQDVEGPKKYSNTNNRFSLYTMLLGWYSQEAIAAGSMTQQPASQPWIDKIEKGIYQIEQITGSGDNLNVLKWRGVLDYAKGDRIAGIRQMVNAHEQFKTNKQYDMTLPYILAQAFEDEPEIGARLEFLGEAMQAGVWKYKPSIFLEIAEARVKYPAGSTETLSFVDAYENVLSPNDRSRRLRVTANIEAGQLDKAQELIEAIEGNKAMSMQLEIKLIQKKMQKLKLEADKNPSEEKSQQIDAHRQQLLSLVVELFKLDHSKIDNTLIIAACSEYVNKDQKPKAQDLAKQYLANYPDDTAVKFFELRLVRDDYGNIPDADISELYRNAHLQTAGVQQAHVAMGVRYASNDKYDQAIEEFNEALKISENAEAVSGLFDIALLQEDFQQAEAMAEKAGQMNIDQCQGAVFSARLLNAKEDYQRALGRIDEAIETRPIMPLGYHIRSDINNKLGNYDDAIADIRKAVGMNPLNANVVKQWALLLYDRNLRLGNAVTEEERSELDYALITAIRTSPYDWKLQSIYAEYISDQQPEKALAIRQQLRENFPNLENTILLANMAMKIAKNTDDPEQKKALEEIAGSSYETALKMAPDNKLVAEAYSEFLRSTGRQDQAEKLFADDKTVLWKIYLRDGKYQQAKTILMDLYSQDPSDKTIVYGLISVAERTSNRQDLKTYTEKLIELDDSMESRLLQLQKYLDAGLIQDTTGKLASFRDRYPDEPRGILLEAFLLTSKGEPEKAIQLINRVLETDQSNALAWRLRGHARSLIGQYDGAIEDLQKSMAINDDAQVRLVLARTYDKSGRLTEAIGTLNTAIKDGKASEIVWVMLENYYIRSNRTSALKKLYEESIARDPESSQWYFRAGSYYMDKKDYAKAQGYLADAWKFGQNSAALELYLKSIIAAKEYTKAINLASKHIDTKFAPTAYCQMAHAQFELGNRQKATEYYHKALEKAGTNDAYLTHILELMSDVMGPQAAYDWCNQKLASNPDSMAANLAMHNIAAKNKEYNRAIKYIDKCISLTKENTSPWYSCMAKKALTLSGAYQKTLEESYLDDAIAIYEQLLKITPNNVHVMNNLAYFLAINEKNLDIAEKYAKRASEIQPDQPSFLDTYAFVLTKSGKYEKAEKLFVQALQVAEKTGSSITWEICMHLGEVYQAQDKKSQALEMYRRALESGNNHIPDASKEKINKAINELSK